MYRVPRINRSGVAKPTVLLVDDHRGILERVSAMLAGDFDVAGMATDGELALDMAEHVDPDAIVLDINMPGMDGFQTKRALEQAGSRAPVVFLSALEDDDCASEAFRCGGRGYVVKPSLTRDLASALDQVLLGRLFAPSLTSLYESAGVGGHAVQLHDDAERFLDRVAALLHGALRRGDATCVIGTEAFREGVEGRLRRAGWDVGGPSGHRRYLAIDAADALSRVMRNGLPDATLVGEIASELDGYRRTVTEGTASRLTISGNVAVSLVENGDPAAGLAIERQWHTLTRDLPFFTVCGYHVSCFHDSGPDVWSDACAGHSAVSHSNNL
jgi:DNA-binding NarL/FixJ family response regulator